MEHYLLLASPGDALLRELDVVVGLSAGNGPDIACARRVGRKADRPAAERAALAKYYRAHVWPAFLRYTLTPLNALRVAQRQPPPPSPAAGANAAAAAAAAPLLIEVDTAAEGGVPATVAAVLGRLVLHGAARLGGAGGGGGVADLQLDHVLRASAICRTGFKLFLLEVRRGWRSAWCPL